MQRFLLDTNILMYILNDTGEMSAASVRELLSNWHKYSYMQKRWKSPQLMLDYLYNTYYIDILYPNREHYMTLLGLRWNETEDHRDTTDLLIIAHAITERMTLIYSDRKFPFYREQGLELIYNQK